MTKAQATEAAVAYVSRQPFKYLDLDHPRISLLSVDYLTFLFDGIENPPIEITDWWGVSFRHASPDGKTQADEWHSLLVRDRDGCVLDTPRIPDSI